MKRTKDDIRIEALSEVRKWKRGSAAVSMGVGKTRLGLEHFQLVVDKYQREAGRMARALVVAPFRNIIEGWNAEAEKWDMTHLLPGVEFVTYRSLTKKKLEDYDAIYLDECHSLKLKHGQWLNPFKGHILGLTGTPPKYKSSIAYKLMAKFCPIRYEYLTDEAIDDEILNDYRITVHLLDLGKLNNFRIEIRNPKTKQVTKSWLTSETVNYNYWSERVEENSGGNSEVLRMKSMQTYPSKDEYARKLLREAEDKCLVFANTKKQADSLCKHSFHSSNKESQANLDKFQSGEIDKMSCVLQLSVGANIKGLKECIILHAYGNNRKSAQRIGRMLRLNPDDMAHVHILCFKDTIDETWVKEALESFSQDKITWYDPNVF